MSEPFQRDSHPAGVLRAAGVIGAATFLSRILGLVREQVIAVFFGAGNATDAFNVAFRIPNLLRNLFAEGALSASLVPTFTRARIEEGDRRAWRVAGLVFRVLLVVVGAIGVLGILFAPGLVHLYASAFEIIPGKFELTVRMTRSMFAYFPLVALAAAFMGVLNACGVFFVPALSSALFNVASVTVGVVLAQYGLLGSRFHPIEGMALGVLVGGVVQVLWQLPALYRAGYRWERKQAPDPSWWEDPALKRILWMMAPGTIGLAATQVSILINTLLATSQGPGAVSWLNYSFRLMQFPIGIFGVSLASATLPRVSRLWVERDIHGMQEALSISLRHAFAVNLPASAGLAFLGYPIIELLFQYGRFYSEDTSKTAMALAMYAIGLTAYSAVKLLVPVCYAIGNTRVPVVSAVIAVATTIFLNLLMIKPFGYWGLALGTSLGAILNALLLLISLRALIRGSGVQGADFPLLPLLKSLGQYSALALAMGVACRFTYEGFHRLLPDQLFVGDLGRRVLFLVRAGRTGLVIAEGGLLVALIARIFGLQEINEALDLFLKKIKNKMSRLRN